MTSPEEIRHSIERAIPGARVHVEDTTGAGDHFEVMPRIHALSIRTAAS
jgi:acid stress-induced BolA-like protein IbaG/YrbA